MLDRFEEIVVEKFKKEYNVNLLTEKEIRIGNFTYPNYCIQNILNLWEEKEYRSFEYCRIINKIFGFGNLSLYENNNLKIEPNDIVFDLGANTGIFSLYAANKSKEVLAFEPSTLIRHYLRNTQYYNNNICIIPCGIYKETKEDYFLQTDNPGAARIQEYKVPDFHKIIYKEKIKLITLDEFVKEDGPIPTYIKMDIENGEYDALLGALETIKNYRPKMAISLHEETIKFRLKQIMDLLIPYYNIEYREEEFYDPIIYCIPREEIKNG